MVYPKGKSRNLKPALVAALCLAVALVGAFLLYRDYNQSAGAGLGPPMAKLERREAKVRRKPAKSFAWSNAQQDEMLYRRDSVQTSVGSAAAIRFNDGTLLELGENSLVVIDDIQNLSLDFLKGAVVVHTAQGDKRVTVGSDGKAKFEELPIRLVKPEPLARYFTRPGEPQPIRFAWKPRSGRDAALPAGLSVQISPDRGFRGSRTHVYPVLDPSSLQSELPLGEGTYFWRLVSASEKTLTDVGQFRVVAASTLQPVSPGDSETLVAFGDETATQFRWQVPDESSSAGLGTHELQLSRRADFGEASLRQEIAASSGLATVRGLREGAWFWRIQSRYGEISVASRTERFAIAKAQRPSLALTLPEDKRTIERVPGLRFSWSSDSEGLDYAVEIKSAQGKDAGGARTRSRSYVWANPAPGRYRWRVLAYHRNEVAAETAWRSFSVFEGAPIALRAPQKGQEIYYWEKPSSFDFEWQGDELLEREPGYAYQVVISQDADFKKPILGPRVRKPSLSREKLSLPSGRYFWKVIVADESGQTVKSSDAWRFAYGVHPLLKAPEGLSPPSRAVFNILEKEQDPQVSWSEIAEAEAYDVTLYAVDPGRSSASAGDGAPPPGSRVVLHKTTDKTSIEFKKLEPASYVWVVRAIDRMKRKGEPMAPRPFTITYGDVLGAPQVITPEVQ